MNVVTSENYTSSKRDGNEVRRVVSSRFRFGFRRVLLTHVERLDRLTSQSTPGPRSPRKQQPALFLTSTERFTLPFSFFPPRGGKSPSTRAHLDRTDHASPRPQGRRGGPGRPVESSVTRKRLPRTLLRRSTGRPALERRPSGAHVPSDFRSSRFRDFRTSTRAPVARALRLTRLTRGPEATPRVSPRPTDPPE